MILKYHKISYSIQKYKRITKIMARYLLVLLIMFFWVLMPARLMAEDSKPAELKTINLLYIKDSKLKDNKYRLEVVADDLNAYPAVKINLKDGITAEIDTAYNFINFISIKVWWDRPLKDKLIGEIKVDRETTGEYYTINPDKNNSSIELMYRLSTGEQTRDEIFSLRQQLATLNKTKGTLQRSINTLTATNIRMKRNIEYLRLYRY